MNPRNYLTKIFILFFLLIFIIEGLSVPFGRLISYYLVIVLPVVLLILDVKQKRKIIFPKKISVLFLGFFIFSLISVFSSLDRNYSIYGYLLYLGLYLNFIFVYNHKSEIEKILTFALIPLGIIFSIFALLITVLKDQLSFLVPQHGYQLVFSRFGHNHLGDFLVLPMILSLYLFNKTDKRKYLIAFLFFTPFFILSFSRSGYLTFFVTAIIFTLLYLKSKSKKPRVKLFLIFLSVITILLLFTVVKEAKNVPVLGSVNQFLQDNFGLKDKNLFASRLIYLRQGVLSFVEKPLFGVGPGNFGFISWKYKASNIWTFSSHNIFIDILVENGVLAFLVFIIILLKIIYQSFKRVTIWSFLFLALLINFQTDYTFNISSLFFLFFILMGLIYQENNLNMY